MTIDQHTVTAIVNGNALDGEAAEVTLDEAWSPYARVQLTCALPDDADRELLDLRDDDLTLDLTLRQDFGAPWPVAALTADIGGSAAALTALLDGQPLGSLTNRYHRPYNGSLVRAGRRRPMRLYVIGRVFDDVAKTLTITAASFEAQLQGDALLASSAWSPGSTSLRTIATRVLTRYGHSLAAGTADAVVAEAAATLWQPAVTAWAYLDPMLEAASLRLWCDERGVFHLTERQSTTPGAVALSPTGTMTGFRDSMSLDPEVWFDAVSIEYRWTAEFDLNQVAYDYAGPQPARAVKTYRRDTRYPGPGAAAGILARAHGRGRLLDVEAVSDYTVSPGMAATIAVPVGDTQTGYVASVVWRLPEAEMDVATRGLTDTPATSWLFVPPGVSWNDIPVGVSWLEYEGV